MYLLLFLLFTDYSIFKIVENLLRPWGLKSEQKDGPAKVGYELVGEMSTLFGLTSTVSQFKK